MLMSQPVLILHLQLTSPGSSTGLILLALVQAQLRTRLVLSLYAVTTAGWVLELVARAVPRPSRCPVQARKGRGNIDDGGHGNQHQTCSHDSHGFPVHPISPHPVV
jgi:hypothetical protein